MTITTQSPCSTFPSGNYSPGLQIFLTINLGLNSCVDLLGIFSKPLATSTTFQIVDIRLQNAVGAGYLMLKRTTMMSPAQLVTRSG